MPQETTVVTPITEDVVTADLKNEAKEILPISKVGPDFFRVVTDSGLDIPTDGTPFFVADNVDELLILL